MGENCGIPCDFGEETPKNSGNCVCEAGYNGFSCDSGTYAPANSIAPLTLAMQNVRMWASSTAISACVTT